MISVCYTDTVRMGFMLQISKRQNRVFFLILWCFVLLLLINVTGQGSKPLFIEVFPSQPISGQAFKVSVYDPTLTNTTPYLSNVHIIFENTDYIITDEHPNRELELTAPRVYIPTTFSIEAYKESYNATNKTITILPTDSDADYLIITLISDSIRAHQPFTLRVTDRYNIPIEQAIVSIQGIQTTKSDGTTNKTGFITLIAPNEQEINILAQKQGFQDAAISVAIDIKQDYTTSLLSHPFLPVFLAFLVLIGSIIFVFIKNNKTKRKKPVLPKPPVATEKKSSFEKNVIKTTKSKKQKQVFISQQHHFPHSSKIEEINITKPRPQQKMIEMTSSEKKENKEFSLTHQWHSPKDSVESQVDELLSKKTTTSNHEEWFEGITTVRDAVDRTINKKKKKSKST